MTLRDTRRWRKAEGERQIMNFNALATAKSHLRRGVGSWSGVGSGGHAVIEWSLHHRDSLGHVLREACTITRTGSSGMTPPHGCNDPMRGGKVARHLQKSSVIAVRRMRRLTWFIDWRHSPRWVSPQRLRVQESRFPLGYLERFSSAAVNNTTHRSFASIPTGFDRPGVTL